MKWERLSEVLARLEAGTPPPAGAGPFGASPRPDDCRLVLVPVPWDATVSYGLGTAAGPEAIVRASHQLDLEDGCFQRPYAAGITMLPADPQLSALNVEARAHVERVLARDEVSSDDPDVAFVNAASQRVNSRVRDLANEQLGAGRLVGVVGGDHSSPFGLLQALARRHPDFGILHIDAHHDLRVAYEGFEHSHASIMHNVLAQLPEVRQLVQVGIRDYSRDEAGYARTHDNRIAVHYSRDVFKRLASGHTWADLVHGILAPLPEKVYVSFDIDGLDPSLCPSTGTPVPGGLDFEPAIYLLEALGRSGRQVIGFDLCEVAPGSQGDEWDANVGARILYKLCGLTLHTNGYCGANA